MIRYAYAGYTDSKYVGKTRISGLRWSVLNVCHLTLHHLQIAQAGYIHTYLHVIVNVYNGNNHSTTYSTHTLYTLAVSIGVNLSIY